MGMVEHLDEPRDQSPEGMRVLAFDNDQMVSFGDYAHKRVSMEKLRQILENLWHGDDEVQIQAAMELCGLSKRHRHSLAESGVMIPLVSMLHSEDYETIKAALCALVCLAFSERNKMRIIQCATLPILLNLLQSQCQTLVQLTIVGMLALSSCKAYKAAIASSGAVNLMAQFVNSSNTQIQFDAIATLHNLTTCQEIIPFIISSGVILSLLELIYNSVKSSTLVEKASGLLESIVSSSESALSEAASIEGAIPTLVETIEDGSFLGKEHAVGILLLICGSSREKYRVVMLREGVMSGLLQLSVYGTRRAKNMTRQLLSLLRECPGYSSRPKKINHDLITRILEEIEADEEELTDSKFRLLEQMIPKLNA